MHTVSLTCIFQKGMENVSICLSPPPPFLLFPRLSHSLQMSSITIWTHFFPYFHKHLKCELWWWRIPWLSLVGVFFIWLFLSHLSTFCFFSSVPMRWTKKRKVWQSDGVDRSEVDVLAARMLEKCLCFPGQVFWNLLLSTVKLCIKGNGVRGGREGWREWNILTRSI